MEMEFRIKFNTHGFEIGKDISNEDWTVIQAEFMAMYDSFANQANKVMDKINDVWDKYEEIKKMADSIGVPELVTAMARSMEIPETYDYNDWVEKWYKQIIVGIDFAATISQFKVRSNIFRDGDVPIFGGKFKDKPEWTFDFELEPVG